MKNRSFYDEKEAICSDEGTFWELKIEYYGVLRIECIIAALEYSTYKERMNAIDTCIEKRMVDYEPRLWMFQQLYGCNMTEPIYNVPYVGLFPDYIDECELARLPPTALNMSGTIPYEQYWYDAVTPKTCSSECCALFPEGYHQTDYPFFIVADSEESCDDACAKRNAVCSSQNQRAHSQEADDCYRMNSTMASLSRPCGTCQTTDQFSPTSPYMVKSDCYITNRTRKLDQYDCKAKGQFRERLCWCEVKNATQEEDEEMAIGLAMEESQVV